MANKIKLFLIMMLAVVMTLAFTACDPKTSANDSTGGGQSVEDSTTSAGGESSIQQKVDADLIASIPDSDYVVTAKTGDQTATANWFAVYGETALELTAYVTDNKIYKNGDVYSNDGVAVYLAKAQRVKGYSEGAISVTVDANGTLIVKNLKSATEIEQSGVTATVRAFTFDEYVVAGYKVELSIPYTATEINASEKDGALILGLTNASNAMSITTSFDNEMMADIANVHTWISLTADNTFVQSEYANYGAFWGDAGDYKAMTSWNLDNDVKGEDATIHMDSSDRDNFIFAHQTANLSKYYFEVKLHAGALYNNEAWGKFGIIVFDADGKDGFFYYIDAAAANGEAINESSVGLGYNARNDGAWAGMWAGIGSLGGTASSQYLGEDAYVTLGVYRQDGAFKLYANGTYIDTVSCGIIGDETAYVGLASFNIEITAKDYSIKTEGLEEYEIQQTELDYLFIGDSYIDTAFWYTWESEFGALNAENIGVGGTKVEYWKNMAPGLQAMYKPANIIVHIGVNDIDSGASAEDTIASIKNMFETYRTLYPEVNIYYAGLVNNMMFPDEWEDYEAVNVAISAMAQENDWLTFIDMASIVVADDLGSTMSWFIADGLHYGVDGYAVFNREIAKALGLARVENEGGLGELNVEGAPDWSYSGGWKFSGDGVAHNTGKAESQIFIEGAYGVDLYAEASISVAGLTASDAYPKAGLAIRTTKETYFWFLDCAIGANNNGDRFTNNWTNVVHRPENINRDWNWGCELAQYEFAYATSYDYDVDKSFKTMAVAKVGSSLYFIADGKVVTCMKGVLGENEAVAVSIFNFNMDMYAKNGLAITEASALKEKLDSLKIYENESMTIDASMADWTEAMKTNPVKIPATDGREVTIYATLGADGVYIFADAIVNSFRTDGNWWDSTNVEFRLGNEGNQRFASAKATGSVHGYNSRWEDNGQRQVNASKFMVADENGKKHIKAEIFVSFACIDGYDANSELMIAGFAWKTGGEGETAWAGGDFWYSPEADPGLRTVGITKKGIVTGTEKAIDGSASDWAGVEMLNAVTSGGITGKYAWKKGADGLYAIYVLENAKGIDLYRNKIHGDWWQNTNIELFDNGGASHWPARLMFYNGALYHTGNVSDAAFTYENDTLIIEFFIAPHLYRVQPGETFKVDVGGWTRGSEGDFWQDFSRDAIVG